MRPARLGTRKLYGKHPRQGAAQTENWSISLRETDQFYTGIDIDAMTGEILQSIFNPDSTSGDLFGSSVALFGDKALIGAERNLEADGSRGSAWLYTMTPVAPVSASHGRHERHPIDLQRATCRAAVHF
jgi:hypothetical protein